MSYGATPPGGAKIKTWTKPSADRHAEQRALSSPQMRRRKGSATLEDRLAGSYKVNPTRVMGYSPSTPGHLSQEMEKLCPGKAVCVHRGMDVRSSCICHEPSCPSAGECARTQQGTQPFHLPQHSCPVPLSSPPPLCPHLTATGLFPGALVPRDKKWNQS